MPKVNISPTTERYCSKLGNDQTKLCLDPWSKVFIKYDGSVSLCCNAPPIGSLKDNTIDEIVINENAMKYRNGLISGDLEIACAVCPDRRTVHKNELIQLVSTYLYSDGVDAKILSSVE